MVNQECLMLKPILPARWTDLREYTVTKVVAEWSLVQGVRVFATSAAMNALGGHVATRLDSPT